MRVSFNQSASTFVSQLQIHNQSVVNSIEKLSSGLWINKAADNVANLTISEKMRAQIRGLVQAQKNIQDGTSLIQTAEAGLSQISNQLQRARELTVQAANDTLTDLDRVHLNREIQEILAGINDISNNTQFNNIHLLNREKIPVTEGDTGTTEIVVEAGIKWNTEETGITKKLNQIVWSQEQFVAIGDQGEILISSDGSSWSASASGTNQSLNDIAWGGHRYAAVGAQGTIITSLDGTNWSTVETVTTENLNHVIWEGGQFVAVGERDTILTSTDGVSWAVQNERTGAYIDKETVVSAPSDTVYVQGTHIGVPDEINVNTNESLKTAISNELTAISDSIVAEVSHYENHATLSENNVAAINEAIVNSCNTPAVVKVSDLTIEGDVTIGSESEPVVLIVDRLTASKRTDLTVHGSLIVLDDLHGNNRLTINTDGDLWVLGSGTIDNQAELNIGGQFYAGSFLFKNFADITADSIVINDVLDVKNNLNITSTSDFYTGTVFTANNSEMTVSAGDLFVENDFTAKNNLDVTVSGTIALGGNFVAEKTASISTGEGSTSLIISDGSGSASGSDYHSVVWNGSYYTAVGTEGRIVTSTDGVIWALQKSGTNETLHKTVWNGSKHVAIGTNGVILTSSDGETWNKQDVPTDQDLNDITWNGSQFVVVGSQGTILTSSDGETWNEQLVPTAQGLQQVIWDGDKYVSIGKEGGVLTSSDGEEWTMQNSGTEQKLQQVIWNGDQFVAVGAAGTIISSSEKVTTITEETETTEEEHDFLTLQVGPNSSDTFNIHLTDTRTQSLGLNDLNVNSREAAAAAISKIGDSLQKVISERSKFGSYFNRLEHTYSRSKEYEANLVSAESRIRDTDMAKEIMAYTKSKMLAQTTRALFTQANQNPYQILLQSMVPGT